MRQIRRLRVNVVLIKPAASAAKEADAVLPLLPKYARCALLCAGGKSLNSEQFAAYVSARVLAASSFAFVIGGAGGADKRLRAAAGDVLSLSALTFPHALARLLLIEQLFRADCAMRNHPYPR